MVISQQLKVNLYLTGSLVFGTISSLLAKGQGLCITKDHGKFQHPFLQSIVMAMGQSLCLILFLFFKENDKTRSRSFNVENQQEDQLTEKPKIPAWKIMLPAFFDITCTILSFFSLLFMPASIWSMFKGGNLIITAIFSVIFLKQKIYSHNLFGMFWVIVGMTGVGLSHVLDSEQDNSTDVSSFILGVVLLLISFFALSGKIICEEKFFRIYSIDPLYVVGMEGIWGLMFGSIAVLVAVNIDCPSIIKHCPGGQLQNLGFYLHDLFTMNQPDQPLLLILVILGLFSTMIDNAVGVNVTQFCSALSLNVVINTRPIFVWIFSLSVGWESFKYIQLISFVVLCVGSMIYNQIIIIPFWGLNKNTRKDKAAVKLKAANSKSQNDSDFDQSILLPNTVS